MKFEPIILQSRDGLTATLYLADNTQVLPVRCDAVVTDPPYGIGKTGATQRPLRYQRQRGVKAREWDAEAADVRPLLSLASRVAIWGGNYYEGLPPSRGWLIWSKLNAPPSMADAELAWTNLDMNTRTLDLVCGAKERTMHPTSKPVMLMQWTLDRIGVMPGEVVLDPYMGSGSTGVACVRMGFHFIGIEREEDYFHEARERIAREMEQRLL